MIKNIKNLGKNAHPGTNVFCGDPLMKGTPSSTHARPNSVEGASSGSFLSSAARSAASLPCTASSIRLYRSVLAVHSTMTVSTP